ncbi:hypothetical protein ACFXO9_31450 [Nocardia tengchongensis]|uniref:hypothetical protein n=1 Tax=Nocardia tengchongensis TaxID=2055889 RepID=UPI0036C042B9
MRYRRPESKAQFSAKLTSVRRHLGKIFGDIFSAIQIDAYALVSAAEAHALH